MYYHRASLIMIVHRLGDVANHPIRLIRTAKAQRHTTKNIRATTAPILRINTTVTVEITTTITTAPFPLILQIQISHTDTHPGSHTREATQMETTKIEGVKNTAAKGMVARQDIYEVAGIRITLRTEVQRGATPLASLTVPVLRRAEVTERSSPSPRLQSRSRIVIDGE